MSPESLKIVASANTELSSFLRHASANGSGHADPDELLSRIESQLPAIASILEKAGRAIRSSAHAENPNQETQVQIDLYTRNMQGLKTLLSPLLASAQARRQRLADKTRKIDETQSWLRSLQLTKLD